MKARADVSSEIAPTGTTVGHNHKLQGRGSNMHRKASEQIAEGKNGNSKADLPSLRMG